MTQESNQAVNRSEEIFIASKPVVGVYPAGPHRGKPSVTGSFHFVKEIATRSGKKMCSFKIGNQKCICFDNIAGTVIEKHATREQQELIAVGRYNQRREFIADWLYLADASSQPELSS